MAHQLLPWAHQALRSQCSSSSSSGVLLLATPQALLRLVWHRLASMLCNAAMSLQMACRTGHAAVAAAAVGPMRCYPRSPLQAVVAHTGQHAARREDVALQLMRF
jgi:hypothetical protein